MNPNRIISVFVSILWAVTCVPRVAFALNTGDVVIANGEELRNYSTGVDITASRVGEVFSKIGFNPDHEGNYYFIVLTDTHIYAADEYDAMGKHPVFSRDTAGSLRRVIDDIGAMAPRPVFVVVTGDLVHDAKEEQFQRFRQLFSRLNPAIGLHLCLGNHDANRDHFTSVFPDRKPYYSFTCGTWTFVVLDSGSKGSLDPSQGDWFKTIMGAKGDDPVMVFLHYPLLPFYANDDVSALSDAVMTPMLSRRGEKWIVSGHWHSNFLVRIGVGDDRVVRQVVTTASTDNFGYEIPGYRLVCVERNRLVATLFHRVGETRYRIDPPPGDWPVYVPAKNEKILYTTR